MVKSFIVQVALIILFSESSFCQNTILWSVKDTFSDKISFLLGTYHQIGNSFVDSIPQIQDALNSCEVAIFESLDNGENVRKLLNSRSEDSGYLEFLKKSDIKFLKTYTSAWSVPLSKLKPMELLMKLQQDYFERQCGSVKPSDTWSQFDNYLIYLAKTRDISLIGLENDSLQTANISNGGETWKDVRKPIHKWIKNIEKSRHTDEYCRNVTRYMQLSFNYQFEQKCGENPMLKGRNDKWMTVIPSYLENNSCFIAVGLLHLYGDCGLIMQLRNRGYIVSEIESTSKEK